MLLLATLVATGCGLVLGIGDLPTGGDAGDGGHRRDSGRHGGREGGGDSRALLDAGDTGHASDGPLPGDAGRDVVQPIPPSCSGPGDGGVRNCGSVGESCCTSLVVTGNSTASPFYRTYDVVAQDGSVALSPDGALGPTANPATVSSFRLDKYLVTLGRFERFVDSQREGDAGAAKVIATGSGKHSYLNDGKGLVDSTFGGGELVYELGWVPAYAAEIDLRDSALGSCVPFATWHSSDDERTPMNCVTWAEAYAFCIWDGGFLPSETELEYAAAGGTAQREYPWGETPPGSANEYAIYGCNYPTPDPSCAGSSAESVAPVGSSPEGAGVWGQLDLAGEVYEWTLDWIATYQANCNDCAYLTSGDGGARMLKGGSFYDPSYDMVTSSRRFASNPNMPLGEAGFRCARAP